MVLQLARSCRSVLCGSQLTAAFLRFVCRSSQLPLCTFWVAAHSCRSALCGSQLTAAALHFLGRSSQLPLCTFWVAAHSCRSALSGLQLRCRSALCAVAAHSCPSDFGMQLSRIMKFAATCCVASSHPLTQAGQLRCLREGVQAQIPVAWMLGL